MNFKLQEMLDARGEDEDVSIAREVERCDAVTVYPMKFKLQEMMDARAEDEEVSDAREVERTIAREDRKVRAANPTEIDFTDE